MHPDKVDELLAEKVKEQEAAHDEKNRELLASIPLTDIIKYLRGRGYYVRVADPGYDERKWD